MSVSRAIARWTSVNSHYMHRYMREFARSASGSNTILDVGAGVSPYRRHFPGTRWIALDVERTDGLTILGDASHLPNQNCTVDEVVCTEVLEHLPDSRRVLK